MQSIERYGVVALLLLVVTVVAVLVWDEAAVDASGPEVSLPEIAALPTDRTTPARPPRVRGAGPRRLSLAAPSTSRPLAREETGPGPAEGGVLELPGDPRAAETVWKRGTGGAAPADAGIDASNGMRATGGMEPGEPAAAGIVPGTGLARERSRGAGFVAPPAGTAGKPRTYVVRASDTLSQISETHLGTYKRWKEILALNPGLDPNRMRTGTRILLPDGDAPPPREVAGTAAPAAAVAAGTETAADNTTYRVRSGDSLWKISERLLGDGKRWRELLELNPGLDPDRIHAGIALVVPRTAESGGRKAGQPADNGLIAANTGTERARRVR